jgi:hypothetical protein
MSYPYYAIEERKMTRNFTSAVSKAQLDAYSSDRFRTPPAMERGFERITESLYPIG